tara:strand:- start:1018 stop:1188 length:171 start_codon:yes stop_codon:yes gene_type:complete
MFMEQLEMALRSVRGGASLLEAAREHGVDIIELIVLNDVTPSNNKKINVPVDEASS